MCCVISTDNNHQITALLQKSWETIVDKMAARCHPKSSPVYFKSSSQIFGPSRLIAYSAAIRLINILTIEY